ncbi:tetratricopeptide repeat protein [Allomuricauda taeanensis]|uniref:tetratricopeptide repeat protein n=1 Tax=Flagellimonas taeanensis TaxID=1005926 RepID=UPI002E7BA415|nr:tetratricopeptide repeat protein [Allomuricauda taeanensis]MEE1963981.1 tetratricopeptide repeat protein [Allomuricauda taeanensis]
MNDSPYISQERQETFERYLMDQMDNRERSQFLENLEQDAQLIQQFNEFKALFHNVEEAALREQMESFHTELKSPSKKITKGRTFPIYKIAAVIAVLVAMGLWLLYQKDPNEKLYQEYFTADPGLPTVMGNSSNYAFYEAMVDYKRGHYKTAITKWEQLWAEKKDNDTLNYFIGSAYLADGEATKAISYFDRVVENEQASFKNEAAFYQGLAHLKNGDTQAALKSLEKAQDEKSRELIKKLKD